MRLGTFCLCRCEWDWQCELEWDRTSEFPCEWVPVLLTPSEGVSAFAADGIEKSGGGGVDVADDLNDAPTDDHNDELNDDIDDRISGAVAVLLPCPSSAPASERFFTGQNAQKRN